MSKNQPMYVRSDPEFRERIKRHASSPQFNNVDANFTRYAIGIVMDLREALGPRFELEVARLLAAAEQTEGQAA